MSNDKQKLEYSSKTTLAGCIEHLEQLLGGLRARHVTLRNRTEAIDLRPASIVSLDMKARQKGHRESIELELAWRREEGLGHREPALRIRSGTGD